MCSECTSFLAGGTGRPSTGSYEDFREQFLTTYRDYLVGFLNRSVIATVIAISLTIPLTVIIFPAPVNAVFVALLAVAGSCVLYATFRMRVSLQNPERMKLNHNSGYMLKMYYYLAKDDLRGVEMMLRENRRAESTLRRAGLDIWKYLEIARAVQSARIYESEGNYDEAARIYRNIGFWDDAKRCMEMAVRR
jgi:hypothetical protein